MAENGHFLRSIMVGIRPPCHYPIRLGGGGEISAKIAENGPKNSMLLPAVLSLLKISRVRKIEFLQFLQKISPPPPPLGEPNFWVEISFPGSFDLRIFSKLGRIFELSHHFCGFFEKPFFWTFRNFFSPIWLKFLQKLQDFLQNLQEFLQFGGWTNDQTDVPRPKTQQKILGLQNYEKVLLKSPSNRISCS